MKHYVAPWGASLIALSSLLTILCLGITFALALGARHNVTSSFWMGLLLPGLVLGCTLFTIRGYTVTTDAIFVHRLVWTTRLPRAGLQSAQFEPHAMRWSLRTFGNGGFFSFSGFYWNKLLGAYRAYVTDLRHTVVLRYPGRTVVLSPNAPEDFVRELGIRPTDA